MSRAVTRTIVLLALVASTRICSADAEIVVAIRYLLPKGVSHAHLYVYREDGKLIRQLTADNSGQDMNPVFAPDGETIVFTRSKARGEKEYWSIRPRGNGLRRLASAPAWYSPPHDSPYFTNVEAPASSKEGPAEDPPRFRAPDGSVELVLETDPNAEEDKFDQEGHGRHFLLRNLKTGKEVELGKLDGFEGLWEPLWLSTDASKRFLLEPGLRLAFFDLHLNSTDGDTVYALDLSKPRLMRLSPNWAAPIPLPGQPAFLTLTFNRYVPISGSKKTANCTYVERWDSRLHRVRYARTGAAIAYGASIYRPGKHPAVVTIHVDN